ncbi:MAG: UDP-glucose 6-dehydrogenase, partial [Bacteroidota bacterium]|nr:UDP-glucose 6-dehydrogenase [Bacteroidota bacterium]MDX5430204.1 UDP-glucose 6-dehydrogenase [Bacteroidota bacterium]MDX5468966.1 UDP-glucose 6-dehydrogenase [Bacteroidota bacterium]
TKFIYPGIGYGGSCFPKDVKALIKTAAEKGYNMRVLKAVEEVNEAQKEVMYNKVVKHFGHDLSGKTFAFWGLSFKPKTDDMREAPSVVIIEHLLAAGAKVKAFDPVAMEEAKHMIGNKIEYSTEQYDTLKGADALILATEWPEFRFPNFVHMAEIMKDKVVFDGRNIYDSKELKEKGFAYYGIGVL